MHTEKLLFGTAYYDEYMPYDRIDKDMEMMAKAGMNVIRIGESTWSTMEPQEGVFDFTHLHRMLKASEAHGIQVILGTPTYAIPVWLAKKYPDVLVETYTGPELYGRRQNMDITHPEYLRHAEIIIRRMLEETKDYKHIIGYQLDNETKSYGTCSKRAQDLFVKKLREEFHDDLDAMNKAFGLDYWSNRIGAWEDFPDIRGTINASLGSAYQKFQRELVTDFLAWQAAIVQEYARPDQFITHNFDYDWRDISFGMQPEVDQWQAAKPMTVAGCDIYHPSAQDLTGTEISFCGAVAHSLKKDNYLVLETQAQGNPGWLPYPGQLRLQAFSHLASGANSVLYWHWHSTHNACESYWNGILSHNLKENAVYREVATIGADFARIGDRLQNLQKKADVAMLLSHQSFQGLSWFPIDDELTYNDIVRWVYDAFYEENIECDILSEYDIDQLSQYKMIVTPALYSMSEDVQKALRAYVEQGGHLISTFKTDVADPSLKIYADDLPYGMTDVFGMTYTFTTIPVNVELCHIPFSDAIPETEHLFESAADSDEETTTHSPTAVRYHMELLEAKGAELLAGYEHPVRNKYGAITRNHYGNGTAVYIGCYFSGKVLRRLLRSLTKEAGIAQCSEKYPVICKRGINDYGKEILYFFNYSDHSQTLAPQLQDAKCILHSMRQYPLREYAYTEENEMQNDALPKEAPADIIERGDMLTLQPWDFAILERDQQD